MKKIFILIVLLAIASCASEAPMCYGAKTIDTTAPAISPIGAKIYGQASGGTAGYLASGVKGIVDGHADANLSSAQMANTIISNCNGSTTCQTASSNVRLTVSAAQVVSGLSFIASIESTNNAGVTWSITVPSGKYITFNGVKGASGGSLISTAGQQGDWAVCRSYQSSATPTFDLDCYSNFASFTGN